MSPVKFKKLKKLHISDNTRKIINERKLFRSGSCHSLSSFSSFSSINSISSTNELNSYDDTPDTSFESIEYDASISCSSSISIPFTTQYHASNSILCLSNHEKISISPVFEIPEILQLIIHFVKSKYSLMFVNKLWLNLTNASLYKDLILNNRNIESFMKAMSYQHKPHQISITNINQRQLETLCKLNFHNLQKLHINTNKIFQIPLYFNSGGGLTCLDLSNSTSITSGNFINLLKTSPLLQSINLHNCKQLAGSIVKISQYCGLLTNVVLSNIPVDDVSIKKLVLLPHLQELDLSNTLISDDSVIQLLKTKIKKLCLSNCSISISLMLELIHQNYLPKITSIDIRNNKITPKELHKILLILQNRNSLKVIMDKSLQLEMEQIQWEMDKCNIGSIFKDLVNWCNLNDDDLDFSLLKKKK